MIIIQTTHKQSVRRVRASKTDHKQSWRSLVGDDIYAHQVVHSNIAHGLTPDNAMHVYVNSVEGDTSQLPPRLATYAKKRGWLKGF